MDQIYFATNEKQSKVRQLARASMHKATTSMSRVFPGFTSKLAEKILCSPSRPARDAKNLDASFQRTLLKVYGEQITVYQKGNFDRSVVFCHGWSGSAFDFVPFYDAFLSAGYNVVSWDHIGHGNSEGKFSNLFLFVRAFQEVLSFLEEQTQVAGVVAHSMGGSAVISAMPRQSSVPLVLVAPVVPLFETLYASVTNVGISKKWVNLLVENFEERYGKTAQEIDPKFRVLNLKNPLLILQDKKDSYISIEFNKQHLPPHGIASLVETENLGHFRILKAPHIIKNAVAFISNDSN